MLERVRLYLQKSTEAAPLAVFRIFFGLLMFISLVRFWSMGWISKFYIEPTFHFHYYGFDWVRPFGEYTYLLFVICGISSLGVAFGWKYRLSVLLFFLSFTYIELLDKTTYLNHYYFVSVLSFLLIFLPANAYFSVDAYRSNSAGYQYVKAWHIDLIKLFLGIVYFYAGLAKLNRDWLFEALPLKIWLPSKSSIPVLGEILHEEWAAYAFSWTGMLYDLFIPFLLLSRRTRPAAFALVVIFHLMTRLLFPIGMFPYIMIVSTLIYFSPAFHHRLLLIFSRFLRLEFSVFDNGQTYVETGTLKVKFIFLFMLFQLAFPFRFILYPGTLFWTEEGYRFSWRVMLMDKTGYANFKIVDKDTGIHFYVDNSDFLTPFQEKQMSTQADFILEYGQYLGQHFKSTGSVADPAVYVESYVSLNGKGSETFFDPSLDIMQVQQEYHHHHLILSFGEYTHYRAY